jgi:hypothetical protein
MTGPLADPRVDTVRRFLSRYSPFISVTVAILLIAILLPGRQAADTVDDTASGIADTTTGEVPIVDAAEGDIAAKARTLTGKITPRAPAAPPSGVVKFDEAKKKGIALVANCDEKTGRIKIPSRFAFPCTQKYVAPNAGSTWQGVTSKEIVVAYYNGAGDAASEAILSAAGANDSDAETKAQVRDWINLYQSHSNMWGRKVKLVFIEPSGEATDDAAGKADAIKVATQVKAFASLGAPNNTYVNELVARKVMCFCTVSLPIESYIKWSPYVWTTLLASTQGYIHRAAFVNRLKNGTAKFAYDGITPTQQFAKKKRVFGFLYYETEDFAYKKGAEFFIKHLKEKYGIVIPPNRVAAYNGYPDVAATQEQARPIVQKMKEAGVTSIIMSVDPFGPIFFTQEATRQLWGPEWILTGSALTDTSFFARLYDQNQWSHAFGVSYLAARLPQEEGEAYKLLRWQYNRPPSGPAGYGVLQSPIALLFNGVHLAGPKLTPLTFRQGMYAQPIQGRGGITTIASAFGDKGLWPWKEDPIAADDATEIWWDRTAQGEDELSNNGRGLYRYVAGGKRYLPSEWPKGAPKAFDKAGTVTIYTKPPPQDARPCYPSPATKKTDRC